MNTGFSPVECLRKIAEREDKHEESYLLMIMVILLRLLAFWCDGYRPFIKVLFGVAGCKGEFIMKSL